MHYDSTLRISEKDQAPTLEIPVFGAFAEEWLSQCVGGSSLTESQIESDKSIVQNHLLPFFAELHLHEVTVRLIDRYKAQKKIERHQYGTGYSAKSINNHLSVLHRIFDKAIEYNLVEKNPITRRAWMRRDRMSEDTRNWWTPADERKALTVLDSWRELYPGRRLVILLQVMTGLRFSEIRALEPRDIDLSVPGLWVRRAMARKRIGTPKNKRARFQVVPRSLAEELGEWLKDSALDSLLFVGPSGGPLANNSLNRWYRALARQAEITPISSHGARHTSGSDYALMGVGQKMIAKLLGHIHTSATERYTHVQVTETQALVEKRWAGLRACNR
jgi:integrase